MSMLEFFAALVLALVAGGGIGVAVINGVNERKLHKIKRQEEVDDKAELDMDGRLKAMEEKQDAQGVALRFLLYDRIRYLGQHYIADGEIDFDDRRILNDMHRSYHDGLGGNGDLDKLMEAVNELPLRQRS